MIPTLFSPLSNLERTWLTSRISRLEEFLRRRARLQRVEEEVRRRVVLGFFDTLYLSRQFKRHLELKRAARMTAIPQLDVPEILVDNEEERANREASHRATSHGFPTQQGAAGPGDYLSADDSRRTWSNLADISSFDTSYGHPLGFPRSTGPSSPSGHRNQTSAFSFELQEPAESGGDEASAGDDRRVESVSPAQVREMLDDSAWMASIRRSATIRRSEW